MSGSGRRGKPWDGHRSSDLPDTPLGRSYWYPPRHMWARLSIVAGLVVGVAAAGLLLGGLLAFTPEAPAPSVALPSAAPVSVAPSVPASPSPAPSVPASPSPAPSAAPSSLPPDASFQVGPSAPPLAVPEAGRAARSTRRDGHRLEVDHAGGRRHALTRDATSTPSGTWRVTPDGSWSSPTSTARSPRDRAIRARRPCCPLARRALRRLARVAAERPERVTVAILTGRTSADVAARVRVGGITYLGDHGLQSGSFPRGGDPARLVTTFRAGHDASHEPAEALASRVPEVLGRPTWLFVERKGPSVAFHVRQADDRVAARAAVEAAIAKVDRELPPHELAHYRGRLVVDLRPRSAGGKREAVEALLADLRPAAAIAFGDDISDADGFAVLRRARDGRDPGGRAGGRGHRPARHAGRGPRCGRPRAAGAARRGAGAVRPRGALERESGRGCRPRSSRSAAARPPPRPPPRPRPR